MRRNAVDQGTDGAVCHMSVTKREFAHHPVSIPTPHAKHLYVLLVSEIADDALSSPLGYAQTRCEVTDT